MMKGIEPRFNLNNNQEPDQNQEFADAIVGMDNDLYELLANSPELQEKLNETKDKIKNTNLTPVNPENFPTETRSDIAETNDLAELKLVQQKDSAVDKLDRIEKLTFSGGIVDTTDVLKGRSYRGASEKMTVDKSKKVSFLKKIWKYHVMEQAYHEKERVDLKKRMMSSDNLFINEDISDSEKNLAHLSFKKAILGRFIPDIKEMVEEELGEQRAELKDSPETMAVKQDLKKIINSYADGVIDEAGFEQAKREIFDRLINDKNQQALRDSEFYVDNFLEIANQVKEIKDNIIASGEHQEKLAQFDFDLNVVLGKAKDGIKTEKNYNMAEKAIEMLRKTKLGSMVNETTLAVSIGAVSSVLTQGSQWLLRSKALAVGTIGLSAAVSSAFAGVKEGQMQKRERETLEARSTTGHDISTDISSASFRVDQLKSAIDQSNADGGNSFKEIKERIKLKKELKRTEKFKEDLEAKEKFIYIKKDATNLSNRLDGAIFQTNDDGKQEKEIKTQEEFNEILDALAEVEARLEISNEHKIDLISYSKSVNVEDERRGLLMAKWAAKNKLSSIGINFNGNWDSDLRSRIDAYRQEMLQSGDEAVSKKDAVFNKYKNKKVLKQVVRGLATGVTIGLIAQEAGAFLSGKSEGLAENIIKGNDRIIGNHDTALQALRNFLSSENNTGELRGVLIGDSCIKLPDAYNLINNPDGTISLVSGDNVLVDGLTLNPDGSFTEVAKNLLDEQGVAVSETTVLIDQGGTETITVGPEDHIKANPDDFKEIKRNLWYGNDTPMYEGADGKLHGADLNELRTHWGGDNGTGINSSTDSYELSVAKMTSSGSFQTVDGQMLTVDAQEMLKAGKLSIIFSLSAETQNQVMEFLVDPETGKISIPRDSEAGQLLFGEQNGQAFLQAKFAEVVFSAGVGEDGIERFRMLSTAVGKGIESVSKVIEIPPQTAINTALDIPRGWDLPPFVPIGWREPLHKVPGAGLEYYSYQSGNINPETRSRMEMMRSETLKNDPRAKLDHYKEADSYFERMDKEYKEEIKKMADELGEMSKENKASICIPVAGHQEGDQIYSSLVNFTKQTADNKKFELCLFVNHPDYDRKGEKKIERDKTLEEIERFKKDYPEMNVKVVYKVIPHDKVNIGLVRKMLNDAVLFRHHNRGREAEDLIMISNDADNLGIDPRYVDNFIKKFSEDEDIDGILGQIDWDPEAYTKYPLVHIGTRLFQYYEAKGRIGVHGKVGSSGGNYAFKSSIYAGVGGYQNDATVGEDVLLGQSIRLARGGNFNTQAYGGSASRVFTSARRAIHVLEKYGLSAVEQWNKSFSAFDDEVRLLKLNDFSKREINYDDPEFLKQFKINLEHIINRDFHHQVGDVKSASKFAFYQTNVLSRLGIICELDETKGVLTIRKMTSLVNGLKRYQREGVLRRDARSGKKEAIDKLKKLMAEQSREEDMISGEEVSSNKKDSSSQESRLDEDLKTTKNINKNKVEKLDKKTKKIKKRVESKRKLTRKAGSKN